RIFFFFSSRRRHTRFSRDWSSDVCSSDLIDREAQPNAGEHDVESIEDFTEDILSLGVELTQGVVNKLPYSIQEKSRYGFGDRTRSEERRVGKGWRGEWATGQ